MIGPGIAVATAATNLVLERDAFKIVAEGIL